MANSLILSHLLFLLTLGWLCPASKVNFLASRMDTTLIAVRTSPLFIICSAAPWYLSVPYAFVSPPWKGAIVVLLFSTNPMEGENAVERKSGKKIFSSHQFGQP